MQVTVKINDVDTVITLTPEQLASIESQIKPKKFKWGYNEDATYFIGDYGIVSRCDGNYILGLEHGRYRKTKEVAEQSLARNKRANRLEALAEQLNGLKEWVEGEENWYIYVNDTKWIIGLSTSCYEPEKVYMTNECALEICRMLTEGEFSLNGEL